MLLIKSLEDAKALEGKEVGLSDWVVVDQHRIDQFAEATADHQWIHVDTERAAAEMPAGKTIAHGYLTLSLIPALTVGFLGAFTTFSTFAYETLSLAQDADFARALLNTLLQVVLGFGAAFVGVAAARSL